MFGMHGNLRGRMPQKWHEWHSPLHLYSKPLTDIRYWRDTGMVSSVLSRLNQ